MEGTSFWSNEPFSAHSGKSCPCCIHPTHVALGPEGPKEVDLGVQWHKGPALAVGVGWPLSPGPGPNIALSCGARGAGAGGG